MCGKVRPIGDNAIKLLPCPFCNEDLDLELHIYDDVPPPYVVSVYCAVCGAEGPACLSEEEALRDWNVRVTIGG